MIKIFDRIRQEVFVKIKKKKKIWKIDGNYIKSNFRTNNPIEMI